VTPSHADSLAPVRQKLVRRNPYTKEKYIYIGSHAKGVEGWGFDESRTLLEELLSIATESKHIYAHTWKSGDLVIWDNRCLLQRGSGYDADKYRRRMRQTRVMGTGSTLDESRRSNEYF
jgi:alpha-ketoglutarate-dependent 2,4-dichlorophenoxyacetate dioxygenase